MIPRISLIVEDSGNSTYLQRFVTSVKGQKDFNGEILIAGIKRNGKAFNHENISFIKPEKDKWLPSAIKKSSGDLIMICTPSCVLPGNYLYVATKSIEDHEYVMTNLFIRDKDGYIPYRWNRFSLFGKIFKAKLLKNIADSYGSDLSLPELAMSCNSLYSDYVTCDENLFETEPSCLEKEPIITDDIDRNKLWLSQLSDYSEDDTKGYINLWLSHSKKNQDNNDDDITIYEKVELLAELFRDDKCLIFYIVNKELKKIYKSAIDNKDEKAFICVKSFLSKLKYDHNLTCVLISEMGLTIKQYDYLMNYELNDYLLLHSSKLPADYETNK